MLKNSVLEVIGNTPLIELKNIEKIYNLGFKLYAKLERCNPSGSIKDRASYQIIKDALNKKEINNESTIVEATSGNTGISLSMICAYLGLKCVIFMPQSASKERILMMKAYGSEVILTKTGGMKESVKQANEYVLNHPNSYLTRQFDNVSNIRAHELYTANEILDDLNNELDIFISAFGTSGTLIGCSKTFKKFNQHILCYGVEPFESSLINKGVAGPHLIQGIGANFVPSLYNKEYVDGVIDVTNEEAYFGTRLLAKKEGLLVGISSGAALMGALKLNTIENKSKKVVIILPDNGERYLSVEGLYE